MTLLAKASIGIGLLIAAPVIIYSTVLWKRKPSNHRDWSGDQIKLPTATIKGSTVEVKNIRNIKYKSMKEYEVRHYDKTFDLDKLKTVWFGVEPFRAWRGPAHTFVSFGFQEQEYVAVSVEIRREKREKFSPLKGLFRNYEIMYVIGDERDIIKLRTNFRKDDVHLYPIKTTKERMRKLFLSMIGRANKLLDEPEFYNTLFSSCTTNIVAHINELVPGRIPLSYKLLLPGFSDELAYELGLIETNLPFKKIRARSRINQLAEKHAEDPDFSVRIREKLVTPSEP